MVRKKEMSGRKAHPLLLSLEEDMCACYASLLLFLGNCPGCIILAAVEETILFPALVFCVLVCSVYMVDFQSFFFYQTATRRRRGAEDIWRIVDGGETQASPNVSVCIFITVKKWRLLSPSHKIVFCFFTYKKSLKAFARI